MAALHLHTPSSQNRAELLSGLLEWPRRSQCGAWSVLAREGLCGVSIQLLPTTRNGLNSSTCSTLTSTLLGSLPNLHNLRSSRGLMRTHEEALLIFLPPAPALKLPVLSLPQPPQRAALPCPGRSSLRVLAEQPGRAEPHCRLPWSHPSLPKGNLIYFVQFHVFGKRNSLMPIILS